MSDRDHDKVARTSRGDRIDTRKIDAHPRCPFCGAEERDGECGANCVGSRRSRVTREG